MSQFLTFVFLLPCVRSQPGGLTFPSVDLDGKWEFNADPQDVGEKEGWFDTRVPFGMSILTPGAWQTQGVGNTTVLMSHQFEGVGWYRRSVHLEPASLYNDTRIFLWIGGHPGGVMRSAEVYVNGQKLGRHVGYLKPLEMEIPRSIIGKGQSFVLAVAVDSRWNASEEILYGSGIYHSTRGDGFDFGGYGGIVGHTRIMLRRSIWIDDSMHVTTLPLGGGISSDWLCQFRFTVDGATSETGMASVEISEWSPSASNTRTLAKVGPLKVPIGQRSNLNASLSSPKLWYPGRPSPLYVASIKLWRLGEVDAVDVQHVRFGVRLIELNDSRILCNGEVISLRGYGDDGFYSFSMAPPMNKSFYIEQLKIMQPLGYNFIRLHTHALPTEFMDAADEMGFLVNPEFAMSYSYVLFWNLPINDAQKKVYNESFASNVKRMSHHPSVFAWVFSNEMSFYEASGPAPQIVEFYRFAKDFDPGRPCWYSDGSVDYYKVLNETSLGCRNGANPNDNLCFVDVLVLTGDNTGASELAAAIPSTAFPKLPDPLPVPLLLHEPATARTFPRLSQELSLISQTIFRPAAEIWYGKPLRDMARLGFLAEEELWAFSSEQVYTMLMKAFLETWRLHEKISGYEWWLGWSWPGAQNGVFAGDPEAILPKPGINTSILADLQSEVAVLVNDPAALQSAGFGAGSSFSVALVVSNFTFGGRPQWGAASGELKWEAVIDGTPIQSGSIQVEAGSIQQGTHKAVGNASFTLPSVTTAATVELRVALKVQAATVARNHWPLAVFPAPSAPVACSLPIYTASVQLLPALKRICSNAKMLPKEPLPLSLTTQPFVAVVGNATNTLVEAARKARAVLVLLNPTEIPTAAGVAPSQPKTATMGLAYWISPGTTGTMVYNHTSRYSIFGQFLDYRWIDLVTGGMVYDLDNQSSPDVHIRYLPTAGHYITDLPAMDVYVSDIQNLALLWDASLPNANNEGGELPSSGRFIVSGLALLDEHSQIKDTKQAATAFRHIVLHGLDLAHAGFSVSHSSVAYV